MTISFDRDGAVGIITFARPAKLNALTLQMYEDLGAAWQRARDDRDIRALVLTGAGDRAFCVGADLGESIPALGREDMDISAWDHAHQKPISLFKPVIAAVNGLCLGGGFEILLSTDLRVASKEALFGLPESSLGVVPAGGTLVRLRRQIPYAAAMRLLLLGDRITAEEAREVGLVNSVVPHDRVFATAMDWANRAASLSATAVQTIKEAVICLSDLPEQGAFAAEADFGTRAFRSADAREGLSAFAEGRRPRFPSLQAEVRS